jgi:glycosyltransferase involved in cell wall biosynthesis
MNGISVIIPARQEKYMAQTIGDVCTKTEGPFEIIAIFDGCEPDINSLSKEVKVVHNKTAVGQRQAVNQGAELAQFDYILKCDGHTMFDQGFDRKLIADCEYNWTVLPTMYNLNAEKWEPKWHKKTNYMFFRSPFIKDKPLRIQYWDAKTAREFPEEYKAFKKQDYRKGKITEVMNGQGACFFMPRDWFFALGGMDTNHGHWGQMGVEIACKTWLAGGKHMVNKNTWFAHQFRSKFPWPASGRGQQRARKYSIDLWSKNKWIGQIRPLSWIIEKFGPIPTWTPEHIKRVSTLNGQAAPQSVDSGSPQAAQSTKSSDLTLLYYTANVVDKTLQRRVLEQIQFACPDAPMIAVAQGTIDRDSREVPGRRLQGIIDVGEIGRSLHNIYKQVEIGLKEVKTDYVALVEDDILYTPDHFNHRSECFLYNLNRWCLHTDDGSNIFTFRRGIVLSQLIAPTELLREWFAERAKVEVPKKYCGEPGRFTKELGIPPFRYGTFESKDPNVVVCHNKGVTGRKYHGKDAKPVEDLAPWGNSKRLIHKLFGIKSDELSILYYTDNSLDEKFAYMFRKKLMHAAGNHSIISCSQKPIDFGVNVCIGEIGRSELSMYKQMLMSAQKAETRYVAFAEHDCIYTKEHFDFVPPEDDTFYYNVNSWWVNQKDGLFYRNNKVRRAMQNLIANRELLIKALEERIAFVEQGEKVLRGVEGSCEFGVKEERKYQSGRKGTQWKSDNFTTKLPNLDVRHGGNLSGRKKGVDETYDHPGWGKYADITGSKIESKQEAKPMRDLKTLRFRNGYVTGRTYKVAHLIKNRRDYHLGTDEHLEHFQTSFRAFLDVLFRRPLNDADMLVLPYAGYLKGNLHKKLKGTKAGDRHVLNKMNDAKNLAHDMKDYGLKTPLEMFVKNERLVLFRGGRRLEILHHLGVENVPVRVYANKKFFARANLPTSWKKGKGGNSIHETAQRLFAELSNRSTDKYWIHNYTTLYDRHIGHLRNEKLKILEIGVSAGASMLLWSEAFPNSQIFGIDKNAAIWQDLLVKQYPRKNISIMQGRYENEDFMKKVVASGPYDIVIDDGNHHSKYQQIAFKALWPVTKKIYVIEDLRTGSYNKLPPKGTPTTINFLKDYIDKMNVDVDAPTCGISFYYNIAFIERNDHVR